MGFVGRARELGQLSDHFATVRAGSRADRGVAVLIRGRRRVGKSRLVEEFARRTSAPYVHFQAARGAPPARELGLFAEAIATSTLPGADLAAGNNPTSLTAALTLLSGALPDDTPSIAVIDEVPWLLEGIEGGAGELQRVWDTRLSRKPVLLLLLGSDLTTMEQLTGPEQPFHGRGTEMVLGALSPHDVARMVTDPFPASSALEAFDAYLVTGGLPLVAQEWTPGESMNEFLERSFTSSTSALVVTGTRVLDAEFGEATLARQVLTAIGGGGERTFTGIQQAARGEPLNASSLTGALETLVAKRIVAADEPLSLKRAAKDRRYRIADPALRFWLAFVEPALAEVDRGRADLAVARVNQGFPSWRGRAIEPVVRAALERLLPNTDWPTVTRVGGWWPRSNTPEIDLVGADRCPARSVEFVGTIKWRPNAPVTASEVAKLARDAVSVPGVAVGTPVVAVSPAGVVDGAQVAGAWTAAELLAAWP
jgi:uncharacterized protein